MEVKLLNPEQVKGLFKEWGLFATQCYDTPKKYAEKVGMSCFETEHFSGSRTEYVKFEVTGIDRGVAEQMLRHEIGVRSCILEEHTYDENPSNIVKNMQSFRYVDKENFDYTIPITMDKSDKAKTLYVDLMKTINEARIEIKDLLVSVGVDERLAIEEANAVLPRSTNTALTIAFTPEALIHYMHKRLCVRTQPYHMKLARLMKEEVKKEIPLLAEKLVAHCDYLLWCPEGKRCCGKKPTKEQFKRMHEEYKELKKGR